MNLLEPSPGIETRSKAVWVEPLAGEGSAPKHRIIHVRSLQSASPVRLERLGLRVGTGYFKCGSTQEQDWATDVRVLSCGPAGWGELVRRVDVERPPDGQWTWIDLGGLEARAVVVELRRCGVDGWWTGWNLAMDGVALEGDFVGDPAPPTPSRPAARSELTVANGPLPDGVTSCALEGGIRFRTRFLQIGFRLDTPALSFLSIDESGAGDVETNVLQHDVGDKGALASAPQSANLVRDVHHGPRCEPVQVDGVDANAEPLCVDIAGATVTYRFGESQLMRWSVGEDSLQLTVERSAELPLRAWTSSAWQLSFDSGVSTTSVVGPITRRGETGEVGLPCLVHVPRFGTLRVSSTRDDVRLRSDALVRLRTTTCSLSLQQQPSPTGDHVLAPGRHRAEIRFDVVRASPVAVPPSAPPEVHAVFRRCAVTALPYRPDTATLSNNGSSMHSPICMDLWADLAVRLGAVLPGLQATDLLRDSLDRWLTGGPGYGSGPSSAGPHLLEDEYLLTGTSSLLGLAIYLEHSRDRDWLDSHARAIGREIAAMMARDGDGDGLIESPYRRGISGEHQWSTCWFDAVSFGGKDAFANALLYRALCLLVVVLPELGRPDLADPLLGWPARLRAAYFPTFHNPETGWLGGWRSTDGVLHDHAFPSITGVAVSCGLLEQEDARRAVAGIWQEMADRGFDDFRLGLPVSLWPIPDHDLATVMHGKPFGRYMNGGVTHSQARHFVDALYSVGMTEEADRILLAMCASLADGSATGGQGSGLDWRFWDGSPSGYEGQLCDQFGVLASAYDRFVVRP